MAVSCLANLIGISSNCNTTPPDSGHNINELPGISVKIGDQIATEEDESGVVAIRKRIDFAQTKMVQDIRGFLSPKMKNRSILQNETVGRYVENIFQNVIAAEAGQYKGIFIDIDDCNYMSLHINRVTLQLDTTLTTTINITQPMTDSGISTFPITTSADQQVSIVINESFPIVDQRLQLFVFYDAGVAGSYQTNLSKAGCNTCSGNVYRKRMINFKAVRAPIGGDPTDGLTENAMTTISTTGGISIDYSLRCDVIPFVCNMADALAVPLMYKAAIEIIQELQTSQRLNSLVVIHRDDYDLYKTELQTQYNDTMEQILQNVALPHDNLCFTCQKWVDIQVAIP